MRSADVAAVALFVALAVVCYWHLWTGGPAGHYVSGNDGIQMMWFLDWVPYALGHGLDPFHSSLVNAPFGVNLLQNTSCELLGLLFAPITIVFGPTASLTVAETLALAGSATAMYAVARRFVTWRPAAVVAGLLFGFGPYEIGQGLAHLNLSFCVLPPLLLLGVYDLATRTDGGERRRGLLLGLAVVAQFFISSEVLTTTAIMAVVLLAALAVVGRHRLRESLGPLLRGLGWMLGVAVPLLAYPAYYALAGPDHVNGPLQVTANFRADLLGPIVPDGLMRIAPPALAATADHFGGNWYENGSYLGITLLVVLAAGLLWLRRRPALWVLAACGVVAFVLSLGQKLVVKAPPGVLPGGAPTGHLTLPWALLQHLPLLHNVLPVRFSLYSALAAALLLALVLDAAAAAVRVAHSAPVATLLCFAVVAFALFPLVPAVPYAAAKPVPASSYFTSSLAQRLPAGAVAVLYPYPSGDATAGLLWQTEADMRFATTGGYFLVPIGPAQTLASSPYAYNAYPSPLGDALSALLYGQPAPRDAAARAAMRRQLARWRVRSVVAVPPTKTAKAAVSYLTWVLGRPPRHLADAYVWYGVSSLLERSGRAENG